MPSFGVLIYSRPLTRVIRCSFLDALVGCTLRGPFDDMHSIRFAAPRTLWGSMVTFISASTVSNCIIARKRRFVKCFG